MIWLNFSRTVQCAGGSPTFWTTDLVAQMHSHAVLLYKMKQMINEYESLQFCTSPSSASQVADHYSVICWCANLDQSRQA